MERGFFILLLLDFIINVHYIAFIDKCG